MLEELESRRVLSDFSLGALAGRTVRAGDHVQVEDTNTYSFTLSVPARVDVQLHTAPVWIPSLSVFFPWVPDVDIVLRQQGSPDALKSSTTPAGLLTDENNPVANEQLSAKLAAGSYQLDVVRQDNPEEFVGGEPVDAVIDLAVAADTAPVSPVIQNGMIVAFRDGTSHDFAALTETPGVDFVTDFLGELDGQVIVGVDDLADLHTFDVPKDGHVTIKVNGIAHDVLGLDDPAPNDTVQLFRDSDRDGIFEAGEVLDTARLTAFGQTYVFDGTLSKARYALALTNPGANAALKYPAATNYNLTMSYDVPDLAGDSLATARAISPFGIPAVVTDYLSPVDNADDYKFALASGGPFIITATFTGGPALYSNVELDIIRDANSNGQIDSGDILLGETNPYGDVSTDTSLAGTYFVRVLRLDGEGPYTLSVSVTNSDRAGGTLATATNIGDLFGRTHLADFVSFSDKLDIYKFTLTDPGTVTASFPDTAVNTDADLDLIQDINGNGVVESNEILDASATFKTNAGEFVSHAVAAGTYYVRVAQRIGSPAYQMTLAVDTAGNTSATARGMGLSGDAADTIEFVGPGDAADFYKLSIAVPLQLNAFFSLFGEPFTVTIGQDANGNGLIDRGEALLTKTVATADDVRQKVNIPGKGVYFVQITSAGTLGTNYGIVFATAPVDNAGDTSASARNVGVLGATRTFTDFVGDGSIDTTARGDPVLGADDVDDFYRFTLGNSGPYKFLAQFSALTGDADMELSRDDNLNQKVDDDEILAPGANGIAQTLDTPGIYYLRVFRPGTGTTGSADYTLTMSATSTDTAGNTLAGAKFIGTLPAPLATTLVASQFVGRIDLDDFYSFTIPAAGNLFVTTTPVNTALVTEVIRDANANLTIDPGETLASSVKALAKNGQFTVSLPTPGTYYLHIVSNGIDKNYDVSFGFKNAVGTFVLNPPGTTVTAGDRAKLALDWTVPDGASWHTLQDVQIRLRNFYGTLALIKFHEADKTVSLFNPDTGQFGPAKPMGSDDVLANRYVSILLKTSTVTAAGPNSPTVTLTFDIQFKQGLTGRPVTIEAAASDDFGRVQDFAFAGNLNVRDRKDR
jgi:hypothetical protein